GRRPRSLAARGRRPVDAHLRPRPSPARRAGRRGGVTVYLLRHADAGERDAWAGPDHLRPLSESGRQQADQLVDVLGDREIGKVISSPYVRCVETVAPLAERLDLKVEEDDALAEGADIDDTVDLIRSMAGTNAVLCSHGDIVPSALERLAE